MENAKKKNKPKVIALIGKSGSRLEEIQTFIIKKLHAAPVRIYTNRPPQFITTNFTIWQSTDNLTADILCDPHIISATCVGDFVNASFIDDEHNLFVGIFTPDEVDSALVPNYELEVFPLYIETKDRIRLLRQLKRPYANVYEICNNFINEYKYFNKPYDFHITVYQDNHNNHKFKGLLSILDNFVKEKIK